MKPTAILLFLSYVLGINVYSQNLIEPTFYQQRKVTFEYSDRDYTSEMLFQDFGNGKYPMGRDFAAIKDSVYVVTFKKGAKVHNTGASVQLNICPAQSYTLEFRIQYDENFESGLHGKQLGFMIGAGYDGGRGEDARTNGDGASVRFQFDSTDSLISNQLYVYNSNMTGRYGHNPGGQNFSMKRGKWYTIKLKITMQSQSVSNDGKIEVWLDEEKVIDVNDIQFVFKQSAMQITRLSFELFPGGGGAFPSVDNFVYLDRISWY